LIHPLTVTRGAIYCAFNDNISHYIEDNRMINLERGREKDRAHQLIKKMASVWNTDSITVMDILDDQLNVEKPKKVSAQEGIVNQDRDTTWPPGGRLVAYYKAGIRTAKKVPKKLPSMKTKKKATKKKATKKAEPILTGAGGEIFQLAKKKAPKKVSKRKKLSRWAIARQLQKEREAIRLRLQKSVSLEECVQKVLVEIPRTYNRLELGIDLICDRVLTAGYRTKSKDFSKLVRGKLNSLIVDGFAVSTVIDQVRTYGWRGNIIRCLKKEEEAWVI